MKKALLIIGIVGLVLSLCVVGVSASLPIITGPRTRWSEAMLGIVPGAVCSLLFLILAIVGLVLVLMAPKSRPKDEPNEDVEEDAEDENESDSEDGD